jgi:hypothetical protein
MFSHLASSLHLPKVYSRLCKGCVFSEATKRWNPLVELRDCVQCQCDSGPGVATPPIPQDLSAQRLSGSQDPQSRLVHWLIQAKEHHMVMTDLGRKNGRHQSTWDLILTGWKAGNQRPFAVKLS